MLGATTSGANASQVSVPPRDEELTEDARRDWKTGMAFIETCMDFYKGTSTCIFFYLGSSETLQLMF